MIGDRWEGHMNRRQEGIASRSQTQSEGRLLRLLAAVVALVVPHATRAAGDAPFASDMRLITPAGYRVSLNVMCLPEGAGKAECRFERQEVAPKTERDRQGRPVTVCKLLSDVWNPAEMKRLNENHWVTQPKIWMRKVGCTYVQTLHLKRFEFGVWELKDAREYSWDGAACRKGLPTDTCAEIQRECERAQERLSVSVYSNAPRYRDDFKVDCPAFNFGSTLGSGWESVEVPFD